PNVGSGGSIGGSGGVPGPAVGTPSPNRPRYDDPTINSGGSFGGSGGSVPSTGPGDSTRGFDAPPSGGGFVPDPPVSTFRPSNNAAPTGFVPDEPDAPAPNRPAADDPNIRSGGSFGG
ncbi:MAG TPA: hypothetical protein VM536_00020, partial [Chloroflexia bacterium]|nr:hypothetical protein [Chloroflexia bacterium]